MQRVNRKHGKQFSDYASLYSWSVDNLETFWAEMWSYADIQASESYRKVIDDPARMPGAKWFTGSRLNFSENLLRYRDEQTALIFKGEDIVRRTLSYSEL